MHTFFNRYTFIQLIYTASTFIFHIHRFFRLPIHTKYSLLFERVFHTAPHFLNWHVFLTAPGCFFQFGPFSPAPRYSYLHVFLCMHRIFFVLARFSHCFTAFFACLQVLHLALGSFCPFLFLRICIFCLVLSLHSYLFNYFAGGGFSHFFAHWHVSLHVSAQSHSCFHCSIFSAYILAYFSHYLCLFLTASCFSPNIRPLFQPIRIWTSRFLFFAQF